MEGGCDRRRGWSSKGNFIYAEKFHHQIHRLRHIDFQLADTTTAAAAGPDYLFTSHGMAHRTNRSGQQQEAYLFGQRIVVVSSASESTLIVAFTVHLTGEMFGKIIPVWTVG